MSNIFAFATISILATTIALAPAPVYAGSVSAAVDTAVSAATDLNASTNDNSSSANASMSAGASVKLSFGDLISNLNGKGDDTATISALGSATSSTTINIVPVSTLEASASADAHALANAEAKASDRLSKLRAAVHANAAIEAALTTKGYSDDQVVGVDADASTNIWVYVDDSSK